MISEQINEEIRSMYNQRMTQIEIGKRLNICSQQIYAILAGKKSTAGLRIETVDKMFPNAVIHLYGDKKTVNIASNNSNSFNNINGASNETLDKVLAEIMEDSEMDPASKVRAYSIISKYKGK